MLHNIRLIVKLVFFVSIPLVFTTMELYANEATIAGTEDNRNIEQLRLGRALAEINCSRCHGVDLESDSPNSSAPPFWLISQRRPVDTVADLLLSHNPPEGMPDFEASREQAVAIAKWVNWVQPASHGKRLVESNCSACHAVDRVDISQHPKAVAFRDLAKIYSLEELEEIFTESIDLRHKGMPKIKNTPLEIDDMLVFIGSLYDPAIE